MEWIMVVLPIEFGIHNAFKNGNLMEYRQVDNFKVDDMVYVITLDDYNKAHFYYELKVVSININKASYALYDHYDYSEVEVGLVDQYMRFELVRRLDYQKLNISEFGFKNIPNRVLRNIGENKPIFEKLKQKIADTPLEVDKEKEVGATLTSSVFDEHRDQFLRLFPKDKWLSVSVETFDASKYLFRHELSEKYSDSDRFVFVKDEKNYYTKDFIIEDFDNFFLELKQDIHNFLNTDKRTPLLDNFETFKLLLHSFYENVPMFNQEEIDEINKQLNILDSNIFIANQQLVHFIHQANPEFEAVSIVVIANLIREKYHLEATLQEIEIPISKQYDLYLKEDIIQIKRILNKYRKIYIPNINAFNGRDGLEGILSQMFKSEKSRLSSLPTNLTKLSSFLKFYYLAEDTELSRHSINQMLNAKKNIYIIVFSFGAFNNKNPDLKRYLLSQFPIFEPKFKFSDQDIDLLMQKGFNLDDANNIVLTFNEINNVIEANSDAVALLNRDFLVSPIFQTRQDFIDILEFQVLPIIRLNTFEEEYFQKIYKQLMELIDT